MDPRFLIAAICLAIVSSVVSDSWLIRASLPSSSESVEDDEGSPFPAHHGDHGRDHGRISPAAAPSTQPRRNADHVYDVSFYGAKGDGVTNDTQAFLETWRWACRKKKKRSQTSATMLVPEGKTYLMYPVTFKGPCRTNVTLQVQGTIVAPPDPSVWKSYDYQLWILITRVRNFTMLGHGTIDGQGSKWWSQSCKRNTSNTCTRAPTALTFRQSKTVRIHELSFVNSQQMHLDISTCSDVTLTRLKIVGPEHSPNTDGIHIERSKRVSASQCIISTGDDCVSIGPGTYNVDLREITCGPGHGISIGSLGKKGAFEAVSNVTVDTAILRGTENGLRIKTWEGGQGSVQNVSFRHIVLHQVKNPIVIDQFYCDSKHSGTCKPKLSRVSKAISVSGVSYSDITGTSSTQVAMMFRCSSSSPCHTISLNNVTLRYRREQASSFCENAYGSAGSNVLPPACLQPEEK